VRQSVSVFAFLLGRDCGWKQPASRSLPTPPRGTVEAVAGVALLMVAIAGGQSSWQALWLTLIAGPLLGAPWLVPWLDGRKPAP
ncbi:MAG: glucans biosynthesis glucosyltransferase MdoH, partial [Pseudomonadota bacterium]